MATRGTILFCVILQTMTANGLRFASLSHELPWLDQPHSFVVDNQSLVSPGLVFGSCTGDSSSEDTEKCTFVMESKENIGTPDHLRFCNFTLTDRQADERGTRRTILSITAVNENHAVLLSYFKDTREHLSILKFSGCKVADIATKEMTKYKVDIPAKFGNSFDVAAYSLSENIRALVDLTGNVFVKLNNTIPFSSFAVMNTQTKGFFFAVFDGSYINIGRVYSDHRESIPVASVPIYRNNTKYSASTIHNFFGICTKSWNSISCMQVDDQANIKFATDHALSENAKISALKVFNLSSGGLLLLLFRCNKNVSNTSPECSSITEDYFVVNKINSTGAVIGSLYINKFKHINNENSVHFFESDKGEMCLSLVNMKDLKPHQFTLNVTCFEDRDFYKV